MLQNDIEETRFRTYLNSADDQTLVKISSTDRSSSADNAPSVDDDEMWRRMLNIKHLTSSHASLAALKSSRLHLTSSETNQRPLLNVEDRPSGHVETISSPKGASTQASVMRDPQELTDGRHGFAVSESLNSPSASLMRIIKLAKQPAPASTRAEEEADEDALWRDFVCGSEADSEEHLLGLSRDGGGNDDDAATIRVASTVVSPSLAVSDLGTSNRATVGGTTFTASHTLSTG